MSKFKVKCTRGIMPGEWFTTGKTYEVKDGRITKDNGKEHDRIIKNINDLHRFFASQFELIEEKYTIDIHIKGKETIATLKQGKEVIKTAKAKCNPSDEFNFEVGAKLAFERLIGTDTKTFNATLDTSGLENSLSNLREAFKKASGNPVNKPSIKIVKQDKYEVGDKVKIVDKWISGTQSSFGEMDKWLGKVMTIKRNIGYCYKMNEEVAENIGKGWVWSINDIEGKIIEESESPKFDWDGFKQGKFAVHCDTEEKASEFLKECDEQRIRWCTGIKTIEYTNWNNYKKETTYGITSYGGDGLAYGTRLTFDNRETILEYQPSKPTVKEISRQGKIGEYIKITNAKLTGGVYQNGDIIKVTEVASKSGNECGIKIDNGKGGTKCVCNSEYVVLEGYAPEDKTTVKEVMRPAKVGEWVKVVNASYTCNCYKNGDILLVTRVHEDDGFGVYVNTPKTHPAINCKSSESFIWPDEYVVLENYQPTTDKPAEQPFKKAKVGDKIKVVKVCGMNDRQIPPIKIGDTHIVKCVNKDSITTETYNCFRDDYQEYIILEEAKTEFKKAKVGDKIQIVKDAGGHGPKLKIGDIHTVTEIHGDCVSTDMMNVLYDEHHEYIILEESKQDNTINVGDTVEVVNAGSCYSTYPRWFDDFAPKYSSKYSYGNSVKNGFVGNVVAKHKHHDYNNTIYAIQNGDRAVYLMSEKGIKKIHQ